jgi:iron complex transport system substrate-binding protein
MLPFAHLHRAPRRLALAGAFAALASLQGAGGAGATEPPDRVIAAGGVVTEILYALGAQDSIVGVDATSLHPPSALKDKPNVGYVRALSAEGVLSLKPTRIIAIESAGPPDVMRLLREAGVPLATIPEDYSEAGVTARIKAVGRAVARDLPALALAEATARRFAQLAQVRTRIERPRRVLFVLALRDGRPLVGGRNSGADAIIRLAGGVNAADSVDGYKPMGEEAVIGAAPDVILMMDRGAHAVAADELFRLPSFSATPAAANRRLVVMDGLYVLGFGPRTPQAARDLMAAVYPEMAVPALAEASR